MPEDGRRRALELFALSFIALFLELMVIRWVPSTVRLVAYYANLMLISSFLGLGIGATLATLRRPLFGWFPLLLLLDLSFLSYVQGAKLATSPVESRFFGGDMSFASILTLLGIFVLNTAVFVPLGQRIGILFHALAPLRAYSWDLGGSLAGTVCFGLFSLYWFSPIFGMAAVATVVLLLSRRRQRPWAAPLLLLAVVTTAMTGRSDALWSPYYFITVRSDVPIAGSLADLAGEIRTMENPPHYVAQVNQDFYQVHGTLDPARYTPDYEHRQTIHELQEQYFLPYRVAPERRRVAVLGAGGGLDAEAALLQGAERVDAVEIDPVLVELSRRYSASAVYHDPRVKVHVDDARAFLRRATPGYDLVAFGFLDSQALFSSMSNLRLDGFTYTVESFRSAFELLAPGGVLAVSFAAGTGWMAPKLYRMVAEGTGVEPILYGWQFQIVLLATPDAGLASSVPEKIGRFQRLRPRSDAAFDLALATDDWPYLYLQRRTIPRDYLLVIATLMALSIGFVLTLRRQTLDSSDAHFFFMGLGFLLLQTKTIGDCSLYFGATWFVTMLVVAGVLLMVLAANLVAIRLDRFSKWYYVALIASVVFLLAFPRQEVLAWPFTGRLLWTLCAAPLPIFFAGLIFSSTFRTVRKPAARLGANLIGAVAGGFCEYASMAIGATSLSWIVIAAYVASLGCLTVARRRG